MGKACLECKEGEIVDGFCNACGAPEEASTATTKGQCQCGSLDIDDDGYCAECGEFVGASNVTPVEDTEEVIEELTHELEEAAERDDEVSL